MLCIYFLILEDLTLYLKGLSDYSLIDTFFIIIKIKILVFKLKILFISLKFDYFLEFLKLLKETFQWCYKFLAILMIFWTLKPRNVVFKKFKLIIKKTIIKIFIIL